MEKNLLWILLSVYGALLSTANICIKIIEFKRGQDEIKVKAVIGRISPGDNVDRFYVILTNVSKNEIHLAKVYLEFHQKNSYALLKYSGIPKYIRAGEFMTDGFDKSQIDISKIKNVVCEDTRGKKYYASKKQIKELNKKQEER